jgi:hypothetical protein
VADFTDLTLDQPGQGYTLQMTSTGMNSVTTGAFNVIDPAGGPYTIQEGQPLTLNAAGWVDPDSATFSYAWTINGRRTRPQRKGAQ